MKKQIASFVLFGLVVFIGTTISTFAQKKENRSEWGTGLPVTIYATPRRDRPLLEGHDGHGSSNGSSGTSPLAPEAINALSSIAAFERDYAAAGAFTEAVLAGKGELPFSVREKFPRNGDYVYHFVVDRQNGHHYWSFTSLGRSTKSPEQIMRIIMQNPDAAFRLVYVRGENGQRVTLNNSYHLTNIAGDNQVDVMRISPYFFTLTARREHYLQGSATHGIVRDKTGELWLFQEGIGVPGEPMTRQYFNIWIASFMWPIMGDQIKYGILNAPLPPPQKWPVQP
jgi:hypothetical protein